MIEDLWSEMEQLPPQRTAGSVRRRVHTDSGRDLFVGLLTPGNRRCLSLDVETPALEALIELPGTRSITSSVVSSKPGRSEIRVELTAAEMRPVFTPFAEDVIAAVAGCIDDRSAVAVMGARFDRWRNLLRSTRIGMSRSTARALFGELWVLQHRMIPDLGPDAVSAWQGPIPDRRDFLFGRTGVEVRTPIAGAPLLVRIEGERLLDAGTLAELFLVVVAVDVAEGTGGGDTLNVMVERVRGTLPHGTWQTLFRDQLLEYGWVPEQAVLYDRTSYVVREVRPFGVSEGFPRLTESGLPPGIGDITYHLSVDACAAWAVEFEALTVAIRRTGREPEIEGA